MGIYCLNHYLEMSIENKQFLWNGLVFSDQNMAMYFKSEC